MFQLENWKSGSHQWLIYFWKELEEKAITVAVVLSTSCLNGFVPHKPKEYQKSRQRNQLPLSLVWRNQSTSWGASPATCGPLLTLCATNRGGVQKYFCLTYFILLPEHMLPKTCRLIDVVSLLPLITVVTQKGQCKKNDFWEPWKCLFLQLNLLA